MDLNKKIKDWLDEQGYPLEMRVASSFQKKGFRVIQSEYFEDHESGKMREVDVVAHLQHEYDDILVQLQLVIETKQSKHPWVLFCSESIKLSDPARVAQRSSCSKGKLFLRSIAKKKAIFNLPIFAIPICPAYALTQAFTQRTDASYSALVSVSKACAAKAKEMTEYIKATGQKIIEINFPLLVLSGGLHNAKLKKNSDIDVEAVDSSVLVWRNPILSPAHSIVHIADESNLDKLINDFYDSFVFLFDYIEKEGKEKLSKIMEERPPVTFI